MSIPRSSRQASQAGSVTVPRAWASMCSRARVLLTVVPIESLYLVANYKETQIGLMRVGQPATIKVDALDGQEIQGSVESFAPGTGAEFAVIPATNATGNFTKIVQRVPVRLKVEAGPEARHVLVPGLSVEVSVDTVGSKDETARTAAGIRCISIRTQASAGRTRVRRSLEPSQRSGPMSQRRYLANGGKADAAAWIAVAAGTIGAFMATLDTSIVNASLPTIQGEVGATGTEGTWISTAYLVAEIVMIPMAGWLEKSLGIRTLLLAASLVFTVCSIGCGISTSLAEITLGRIGQGFSGGAMIPTALSIVATRLPSSQRPLGTALFGMTAVLGPVIGPVLGGWLTENVSWNYVFFINLPVCIGLIGLLLIGLPADKRNMDELLHPDLLGIAGLILGLGGLTTVLEEGQRERWFESVLIRELSAISVLGFILLVAGQFWSRSPVINLKILLQRRFAGVFVMTLIVGRRVIRDSLSHSSILGRCSRL